MFVATRWDCPQCATPDIDGEVCPNCGYRQGGPIDSAALPKTPVVETYRPALDDNVFLMNRERPWAKPAFCRFIRKTLSSRAGRYVSTTGVFGRAAESIGPPCR